ncbi:magnesium chelatase family protein [Hasllibacter halocynthiae]|uniref:Magnesium chelatase family protein n=1 Tax=Hasllibacter halocynthiae TaxID=595589 RepID=A0A2T0X1Z0_9RHOB|nr:YifB family Mg chelatase-like AAA ATPase [Hasllibacter halocynthiae]PRY92969.1 magnesium chelatase family protein [Hasllibacter halocynthiae]
MHATTRTVAFEGVEARIVEVQCSVLPGAPGFAVVGLPDKAVQEARERVRAAMTALSIAAPARRIVVNLSPADLPKEGSHFDLPIVLALLAAIDVVPAQRVEDLVAMGELSLDGGLVPVSGALPAAMTAAAEARALMVPAPCAPEGAWVAAATVLGPKDLAAAIAHLTDAAPLEPAVPGEVGRARPARDLAEVRGQEKARRALEIAAAGRHHLLMVGPPGAGKSMLAACLPGILPPMTPAETLETTMVHSVAGLIEGGAVSRARPCMTPHHTASTAAIIGGGKGAGPGEVSLAHNGVLFMDEFPEFPRQVLETLRQPVETGEITVSRANAHVKYPCRFLLVAAANPCRCGHLADPSRACPKAPSCGGDYLGRISGPLMDRFDLRLEVPAVPWTDMDGPAAGEGTAAVAERVAAARGRQAARGVEGAATNADLSAGQLEAVARPDGEGRALIERFAARRGLSARGYHRVLRVARTVADLAGAERVEAPHVAEALGFRLYGEAL